MPLIRDDAVVLARLDYSETSQVVVVFTRDHGKIRAIAKGIKRGTKARFAVGIDLLDVGTIVVTRRAEREGGLATVTEWKQTRSLSGLREKLTRIQAGQYAAEISGHLTEDWDPHTTLYEQLVGVLNTLSDADEVLHVVVPYQLALLAAVGAIPRFDVCVSCGRGRALTHFSSFEGGMICRHCAPEAAEKRRVTNATARTLRESTSATPTHATPPEPGASVEPPTRDAAIGPFRLLNYHITHLMGREPRLAAKLVHQPARREIK